MPRTGRAYERPSLVSLALIACLSLAVVVVAGWLVMIMMFSNDANTKVADPAADRAAGAADVAALAGTSAPLAENTLPSNAPPGAGPPSAGMPPPPADGAPRPDAPQARPLATASAGAPPALGAPAAPFAAPSAAGASTAALGGQAPETIYRGPGDLLNFPPDAENAAPKAVPLPPPRPRRTAAVPVPRPRPPIDGEQVPPALQQRSLFDIFGGRQP